MSITGSNNPFACEPVVFANANSIVSLGTITRDGNEFTFSVGFVWKINGVTYQNTAPVVLTISEASEGFTRIDNALLNTSNTIELQQGLESETIALKPVAPDTNIVLTSWNISGTTIGDTEDPIIGTSFVKKSFSAPFIADVTGADAIIPLDPNGYSEIRLTDASLASIAGFDLSLITGVPTAEVPYNGKPYIIRNLTGNDITIKNELGAADFPFYLSGGADLVFPNGQAIYVLYDAAGFNEIFKSWSDFKDVIEGYFNGTNFYTDAGFTNLITPESSKIYLNLAVTPATQYRWSGSAYVQIGGTSKKSIEYNVASLCIFNFPATSNWTYSGAFNGMGAYGAARVDSAYSNFLTLIASPNFTKVIGGIAPFDMKLTSNGSFVNPEPNLVGGDLKLSVGYTELNYSTGVITNATLVDAGTYTPATGGRVDLREDFGGEITIPKGAIWCYSWAHTKTSAASGIYIQTILNFEEV